MEESKEQTNPDQNEAQMGDIKLPKRELKRIPFKDRARCKKLIEQNIGEMAHVVFGARTKAKLITELHPEHLRMLEIGWLQDVALAQNPKLEQESKQSTESIEPGYRGPELMGK